MKLYMKVKLKFAVHIAYSYLTHTHTHTHTHTIYIYWGIISIWDNYIIGIGKDDILSHLHDWNLKVRPESINQQTTFVVSSWY